MAVGSKQQTIVIVGGGSAGWMTAAALSRFLTRGWSIKLVESEEIGTVGVGEATIPGIRMFNAALGIDEDEFIRATQGSFKLGIEFDGWSRPGERYIHAFGQVGRDLGLIAFHHYWLRARANGANEGLAAYSLTAGAAAANRFVRGNPTPNAPLGPMTYAYHFDAGLYAAFLRRRAEGGGVERIEGKISEVKRCGESGDVDAVVLENGTRVGGDLFVDCSGFRGLLIEGALETGTIDWTHWLPCDRALAVPCANTSPLTPYTRSTARKAGWQWRIPLQHRTGNGHVYCSAHVSDDEAAAILLANLDGEAMDDPRPIRFQTGMRRKFWNHNVVALGLASGFMEPLESTSIHLVQSGIERLLKFLPNGPVAAADTDAYNRQTAFEYERIRDFIILHYHANQRDEPFWQACRSMAIPDTLTEKLALFRANGRLFRVADELFTELGWLQVMVGQGIMPAGYHPLADQLSDNDLSAFLAATRQVVDGSVAAMSSHEDFIARHCAAGVH
jgi:tryptophan 7-halogenase